MCLAVITCDILNYLYSVRRGSITEAFLQTEASKVEQELQSWLDNLAPELRLESREQIDAAPLHLLSLHMQYECAIIGVQFPL